MTSFFTLFQFIGTKITEIMRRLGEQWKELPDAEKKVRLCFQHCRIVILQLRKLSCPFKEQDDPHVF